MWRLLFLGAELRAEALLPLGEGGVALALVHLPQPAVDGRVERREAERRFEPARRAREVAAVLQSAADDIAGPDSPGRNHRLAWAELMRRAYAWEVLVCPRCGGPTRLIAVVQEPAVCERILKHVGLWQRGPPLERRVELDPTACA
jgi:hypothetical protein